MKKALRSIEDSTDTRTNFFTTSISLIILMTSVVFLLESVF